MINLSYLYKFIATGFGVGYSPIAPGTVGTLLAVFLYIVGIYCCPFLSSFFIELLIIVGTFVIGLVTASHVEKVYGKDPSCVVIDEIVGMWIALLFIPFTWVNILIAFALFRFFDIAKILGVGYLDKNLSGAWGIMVDDVLAGIYANLLLQIILYLNLIG